MNSDERTLLDMLSEKVINNSATQYEQQEFSILLKQWNEYHQNNLTRRYFEHSQTSKTNELKKVN